MIIHIVTTVFYGKIKHIFILKKYHSSCETGCQRNTFHALCNVD